MSALEELAQAVLDGRVRLEVKDSYAYGERNGSYVAVYVERAPEAAAERARELARRKRDAERIACPACRALALRKLAADATEPTS